jgi:ABC-type Fe3+ transport system substrate-binding protein
LSANIVLRAPEPNDWADILRIIYAHGVPLGWGWPAGKHGIVADDGTQVIAFCVLSESIYGLIVDEIWEQQTKDGYRALALLSQEIEAIAQRRANDRGEAIACGGVVRLDRERHIAALRKRGYGEEAVVLTKLFNPEGAT